MHRSTILDRREREKIIADAINLSLYIKNSTRLMGIIPKKFVDDPSVNGVDLLEEEYRRFQSDERGKH